MIECIFTLDYEIYGNGQGKLSDLVFEPSKKLQAVFNQAGVKFVNFVEVAELEQIDRKGTDSAINDVRRQIREMHEQGHEIGLHIHPQWSRARYLNGKWELDYSEYNLCSLSPERIRRIVHQGINWLCDALGDSSFKPVSFRAGNWLFQPTKTTAEILASFGIKIDSSVFKGGLQRQNNLDYRPALKNGDFWRFEDDVNVADQKGRMLELPIHTEMVPFWQMITRKRVVLQQKILRSQNILGLICLAVFWITYGFVTR